MKKLGYIVILLLPFLTCFGSCGDGGEDPSPSTRSVEVSPESLSFEAEASSKTIAVTANAEWGAVCTSDWVTVSPSGGVSGTSSITVSVKDNPLLEDRSATILFKSGSLRKEVTLTQGYANSDDIVVPEGYTLVWHDEFKGDAVDTDCWEFENWAAGYVNNELQRYVPDGELDGVKTAFVKNGALNIVARKHNGEVISARMNTKEGSGKRAWTYGYMEARILLPSGKGTWPAYWMMPVNQDYDSGSATYNPWPDCGEIDIMEEVGYNPNYTSSSIHCAAYNHTIGTQKTAERYTANAEGEFHVYALEWTEDYIKTFVDGEQLFYFKNDKKGDKSTWPFTSDFYITLNLAWGGSWGGQQGVDETALPATMQVDYVRVFQKK